MLWLYWTAFAILVGAQFNAETMHAEPAGAEAQEQANSRPATAA
jgi:uncharacterized BrkB/YihY/UPF0761 family membrane protein